MSPRCIASVAQLAAVCALVSPALAGLAQQAPPTSPAATAPPTFKIGDPIPALAIGRWLKGEPLTAFAPHTVYVLDFWATWCPTCRAGLIKANDWQKKWGDQVNFIGVNVWEQDDAKAVELINALGDGVQYRIALDDKHAAAQGAEAHGGEAQGAIVKTWLTAAGIGGLPAAMVIGTDGRLAWAGSPSDLPEVLPMIVAGKFSPAEAAAWEQRKTDEDKKVSAIQEDVDNAVAKNDPNAAVAALDRLGAQAPDIAKRIPAIKFQVLAFRLKQYDRAYAMEDAVITALGEDEEALNNLASTLLNDPAIEKRDLPFAQRLAQKAVDLTHHADSALLDTLAQSYFDQGNVEKAVEVESEALAKASPDTKAMISGTLDKYERFKR